MSGLVEHESTALTLPGEHSEVALILPEDLSFEDVEEIFSRIQRVDNSGNWWLGDVMNHCERHHPEQYSQIFDPLCKKNSRYRNCQNVAASVPVKNRRADLSWSCHRAVQGLDALAQEKVLAAAAAYQWGSDELGKRVAAVNAGDATAFNEDWTPPNSVPARNKVVEALGEEEPDDDKPIFDGGDFGDGMSAERDDLHGRDTGDGFDQISKIAGQIGRLTPDLRHRLWRMCVNADDASVIHELFPPSSSHVEHSAPKAAPCEAPAANPPAVSIPVSDPAGGGTPLNDPERPSYLTERLEREGAL